MAASYWLYPQVLWQIRPERQIIGIGSCTLEHLNDCALLVSDVGTQSESVLSLCEQRLHLVQAQLRDIRLLIGLKAEINHLDAIH